MTVTKWVLYAGVAVCLLGAGYMGVAMSIDNVEQPRYSVVSSDGTFEVRDYNEMIVAEITVAGDRREAANRAFSPLANYIFAKERDGDKISMTAPVTQTPRKKIAMTAPVTQSASGDEWTVQFVMPAEYSLETLPTPKNEKVSLRKVEKTKRAVIRFSGRTHDELVAEKETELRDWMQAQGLTPLGDPTYAYYNSPFTPGFLRRNEIMFEVE